MNAAPHRSNRLPDEQDLELCTGDRERVECTFCRRTVRVMGSRTRYRVDCPSCRRSFAPTESVMQAIVEAAARALRLNGRTRTGPPYTVRVFDLYHFMDEREEIDIPGFSTLGQAREYARRRTRDSLEEHRARGRAPEDVRKHWLTFGEDCVVLDDGYRGSEEIDYFAAKAATPVERDWLAMEPEWDAQERPQFQTQRGRNK